MGLKAMHHSKYYNKYCYNKNFKKNIFIIMLININDFVKGTDMLFGMPFNMKFYGLIGMKE